MKDSRSHFSIRVATLKRLLMWHYLNQRYDLVLVSEFPKSGGTWFSMMLAELLGVPFPRNQSAKLERCLLHGHYQYHKNFHRTLCVLRDGRDIMVSAYYHFLFEHDRNPPFTVKKWREKLVFSDYDDIQNNLPRFIEHMFTKSFQLTGNVSGGVVTWSDFVRGYINNEAAHVVKYENLLLQPVKELREAIRFIDIDGKTIPEIDIETTVSRYSFKNQTNRNPGDEDTAHFIRKGIAGDWKNHFTSESIEVFKFYGGDELVLAGYEEDKNWRGII